MIGGLAGGALPGLFILIGLWVTIDLIVGGSSDPEFDTWSDVGSYWGGTAVIGGISVVIAYLILPKK